MEVRLTPAAAAFVAERGEDRVTVSSVVFSSCCSGPLPPEAKLGAPNDAEGFSTWQAGPITVYYDSLLDERPELVIDLREFVSYKELCIQGWE
jgi:hypothetical protein